MILVTGARGNVGREVLRVLRERGIDARAPERREFDFARPDTFDAAVRGCGALFLLRPPPISDVKATLNVLVGRARRAGVRSIVFVSVAGAERNPVVPHHAVERYLMDGPNDWTILRPGFFAQNFEASYRADIVEDGRVYVPAGAGLVTFIDVRDLADVAAMALTDAAHRGRAYTLTGPAPISFAAAADMLSEVIGRSIRYEPATMLGYARHLKRRGLPTAHIVVQTVLHAGLRYGQATRVDPTLEALLARRPRTLLDYFGDHAALFRRAPS